MPAKLMCLVLVGFLACSCVAQDNPVTNGGFELVDDQGIPVDWGFLGDCAITEEAHSGTYAVALQRDSDEGICGLNRVWEMDSGEQGTMLSVLKGGIRFWYKAESAAEGATLNLEIIPMSERPLEDTGESRSAFSVPRHHIGDGQWHEGVLKYDYSGCEKVKWVHISPRLRGQQARMLLDDIEWVDKVGPLPRVKKTQIEEVPGKEGDECLLKALVENGGDDPVGIGIAAVELPAGLQVEGGPLRTVEGLKPDATHQLVWRIIGRRSDKGQIGLSFTAAERKALSIVEYAPELEIIGLASERFIFSPGQQATVSLRVRNNGHAMVRELAAELRPGVPLIIDRKMREKRLALVRPQTESSISWQIGAGKQSPEAYVRAWITAANAPSGRASTTMIVGPAETPEGLAAFSRPGTGVNITDDFASIYNDNVRLLLPRADFGFGIGILQQRAGNAWQTVAKLPRLSRLVVQTEDEKQAEHLVYASEAIEVPSPEAVAAEMLTRKLQLSARFKDANGINWLLAETFYLAPNSNELGVEFSAVPDGPAKVLALEGPMLYVGEGAPAGTRRMDAIFPGLEWLVEGEESSSTLDIAARHPHRLRYVPHPHMVTIPAMCARIANADGRGATVSLMWDHLAEYYGKLNRPSAVFASPDRFEGRGSTLMGLFVPSMPDYIEPNERVAHRPLEVAAGEAVRLSSSIVTLPAGPKDTSLEAMKVWAKRAGLPAPSPLPHGKTLDDEIEFSMAGYMGPLWEEEEGGWYGSLNGPAIWHKTGKNLTYLYDLRMCLELCDDEKVKAAVGELYHRVIDPMGAEPLGDDMGFQYQGPLEHLMAASNVAAGHMRSEGDDGSWRFRTRIETSGVFKGMDYSELGPDNAAAVGTCAHNAWEVLRFARMTGDEESRNAGLRALAFMDQFRVPRAAQVWEVPFHTPDILASADACEAYLEGYKITGERRYLDQAVYWAWTGLPFVYMWDVEGFEFLNYASIPVFGATWFQGSWFGRPVQWNGLRYAYALFDLAGYNDSLDWDRIARGLTISCMYQQSTNEEDKALWPDSISAIEKDKSAWLFPPRMIMKNVYKMLGMDPTPNTTVVKVAFDPIYINAAGKISDASFAAETVKCKVSFAPPQTGYVALANISKPRQVRVNGNLAPVAKLPRKAEGPAWRYLEDLSLLEIKLVSTGDNSLEISGVTFKKGVFTPPVVRKIAFEFNETVEGWYAVSDLSPLAASGGSLETDTSGGDPYMIRANCAVPAAEVKQLRIRMALPANSTPTGQLFWITEDSPGFDEPKSTHFPTQADGEFHEYVIPVGEHDLWKGTIIGLRIDPSGGSILGRVKIDYVRGE